MFKSFIRVGGVVCGIVMIVCVGYMHRQLDVDSGQRMRELNAPAAVSGLLDADIAPEPVMLYDARHRVDDMPSDASWF